MVLYKTICSQNPKIGSKHCRKLLNTTDRILSRISTQPEQKTRLLLCCLKNLLLSIDAQCADRRHKSVHEYVLAWATFLRFSLIAAFIIDVHDRVDHAYFCAKGVQWVGKLTPVNSRNDAFRENPRPTQKFPSSFLWANKVKGLITLIHRYATIYYTRNPGAWSIRLTQDPWQVAYSEVKEVTEAEVQERVRTKFR